MNSEAEFASATHIVFTPSAAGTLIKRISEFQSAPKVLRIQDDLSMGPLDTVENRVDWFKGVFGENAWSEDIEQRSEFWRSAAAITHDCYVWFSRKSAREYCGYLEWASRRGAVAHKVIETDVPTATINFLPEWLKYFAQGQLAAPDQQLMDAQEWGRLVLENAPVRKIESGKIVSAPLDCFDDLLLAKASPEWRSAALMVGEVLADDFAENRQTGDLLLVSRLWALVDADHLEARGDESSIRSVQIRIKPV